MSNESACHDSFSHPVTVQGFSSRPGCTTGCGNPACCFPKSPEIHTTQMLLSATLLAPVSFRSLQRRGLQPSCCQSKIFFPSKPGTADFSMFRSGQHAMIHPVSQPLAVHGIAAGPGVPPAAPPNLVFLLVPVSVEQKKYFFFPGQQGTQISTYFTQVSVP